MEDQWVGVLAAALISALLLLVEHYWPAEKVVQHKFHPVANYVLGTLALVIPQTVLFALWGEWWVIGAMWSITLLGGLAVMGAYALDNWILTRSRAQIAEKEARELRPGGTHGEGPEK